MYEEFFHLSKAPFSMTPDPEFLFLAPTHREALSGLMFTVLSRRGTAVLTGEVGTGKTTLLRKLIRALPADQVQFCSIFSTNVSPSEFFELILIGFGLPLLQESKAQRLLRFWEFLMTRDEEGITPVLLVDEAHKLTAELLEEVRLLMNFETAERKLLQVVLAGQTELRDLLRREDLRQLRQRVSVRLEILPLKPAEVEPYVRHRWCLGGGNGNFPFTPQAIDLLAQASKGIPRIVNAICDIALLRAYTSETSSIGPEMIQEAMGVLEMSDTTAETPAPAVAVSEPLRLPPNTADSAASDSESAALLPLRAPEDGAPRRPPWWSAILSPLRRSA
jgi:general secretion pathway protein A